jgi:hypothetical protein
LKEVWTPLSAVRMVRIRPIPLGKLLLAVTGVWLLAASALAADQPAWVEVHSTHYTVITDGGDKKGREIALRFEQMRAVFANLLSKDRLSQPQPITIFAFRDDKDYYQLAPLRQGQPIDVPGFLITGEDQDFIALNLSQPEPWRAVAHDFGQLLLNYNYPPAQAWFDEGLTQYFSSVRVDNKQGEIGADPELSSPAASAASKSFTELLNQQPWLPISELFATKRESSPSVAPSRHTIFNGQSWIVMHYLVTLNKLPETGAYLDAVLNHHATGEQAIQQAFSVTAAQLDQAVKDYFHAQLPPNSAHVDHFPAPVGPDDSAFTTKPLSNSNARALYAEVQLRIPERRSGGVKELEALAAPTATATRASASGPAPTSQAKADPAKDKDKDKEKDPDDNSSAIATGNEIAHRGLAWDHIQHNEFEEALTELGDAAAIDQRDMWIRYYLSVLKFKLAESKHGEIQGLANMMQDLRAVLEWYPEFADAYDLMAVARMQGGGSSAAMQAERAAMQLSPRNDRYVYHQAQIYIAGKQWEAAKALLERLQASADPKLVAESREKMEQVATERKYGIPTASGPAPAKLEAQRSPFDVLEQDAAQRAAEAQSAQIGGAADKRVPKFIKGRLVRIDCAKAPVAIVTVTAGGSVLKLRTPDYKSLLLIGADDFSCDWRDRPVTVNYKAGGAADGDLVSLEVR